MCLHVHTEIERLTTRVYKGKGSSDSSRYIHCMCVYCVCCVCCVCMHKHKHMCVCMYMRTYVYACSLHYCSCVICMSDYEAGDKLRTLLCSHEYHIQCIDQWLKVRILCRCIIHAVGDCLKVTLPHYYVVFVSLPSIRRIEHVPFVDWIPSYQVTIKLYSISM